MSKLAKSGSGFYLCLATFFLLKIIESSGGA